jgi:hypothetical protein
MTCPHSFSYESDVSYYPSERMATTGTKRADTYNAIQSVQYHAHSLTMKKERGQNSIDSIKHHFAFI